jgi:hypothetical protein
MIIHLPTIEALSADIEDLRSRAREASVCLSKFNGIDTSIMTPMEIELIIDELRHVQKLKIREKLCAR